MTQFTAGPWSIEEYQEPKHHLFTYNVIDRDWEVTAKCGRGPEAKCNAQLIAAAPEMYEQLSHVLSWMETLQETNSNLYSNIESLLKKAKHEIS